MHYKKERPLQLGSPGLSCVPNSSLQMLALPRSRSFEWARFRALHGYRPSACRSLSCHAQFPMGLGMARFWAGPQKIGAGSVTK